MVSAEFLVTSFVVVLIPGTGVVFTLSTGLFLGWRASIYAALGCTAGILPHLTASVLGVAALLHLSAVAFQALKMAGATYLLYLAWATWRDKGALSFTAPGGREAMGHGGLALRAFLLNILNPKLSIFFLAFLPQFVAADAAAPLGEMLLLSAIFMAMTFAVFVVYGVLAHGVRARVLDSPRFMAWMRRGFAAVFAVLGARLALSDR